MSISEQLWFSHIKRPSRYIGNEINAIKKDPASTEISIALAFPDIYEVGMSHQGLKILYHILNSHEWLTAERVFCPWVDLETELRERGIFLATLESDRPLRDFDIVGFSLQHELSFTNILTMLHLAGIPFLTGQRDETFPLVLAGGPACFNPEPVASIFDAILIGDGEEATLEICRKIRNGKSGTQRKKEEILEDIAGIQGVYIPGFFKVNYRSGGTIHSIEPIIPGYREVKKAIIPDIGKYPFPSGQVVPYTELIHDRLAIEICRGCTRGCRFCQAGMIYRPVRERNPNSILKDLETSLRLTGFEEISLLSLSSGDYSCIGPLLESLMDRQSRDRIAVSLPSLRIDSFDTAWFDQIKRVRKTGFTLAPETGNDRLRKVINKTLTNRDILNTAYEVYSAGWNLIKLYFMVGLPSEKEQDLHDIIHLAEEVIGLAGKGGRKARLNVSISTFSPKSHTPFMWVPQISPEESWRRIQLIRGGLKDRRIRVKWNSPEISWIEGVFSRGDRRLCEVLIDAWQKGARFDAWGEHFKVDIWQKAFQNCGLSPEFYLHRSRSAQEIFPWDHIKCGVTKDFLNKEWRRALREKTTPDCRIKCLECGVCDHKKIDPVLFEDCKIISGVEKPSINNSPATVKKYRLNFTKTNTARYLSHLELVRLFIRAFKRAGLKLVYSKGYHPMPKVSFATALPVGTESIDETVYVKLFKTTDISSAKEEINNQLPSGIRITLLEDVTNKKTDKVLKESRFHITFPAGLKIGDDDLERFLQSTYFPITKKGKKGDRVINARSQVKSMELIASDILSLIIIHSPGPELKPAEIIKGIFHLNNNNVERIKILKTKQIMGPPESGKK